LFNYSIVYAPISVMNWLFFFHR